MSPERDVDDPDIIEDVLARRRGPVEVVLHVRKGWPRKGRVELRLVHQRLDLVDGREPPVRVPEVARWPLFHLRQVLLRPSKGSGRRSRSRPSARRDPCSVQDGPVAVVVEAGVDLRRRLGLRRPGRAGIPGRSAFSTGFLSFSADFLSFGALFLAAAASAPAAVMTMTGRPA